MKKKKGTRIIRGPHTKRGKHLVKWTETLDPDTAKETGRGIYAHVAKLVPTKELESMMQVPPEGELESTLREAEAYLRAAIASEGCEIFDLRANGCGLCASGPHAVSDRARDASTLLSEVYRIRHYVTEGNASDAADRAFILGRELERFKVSAFDKAARGGLRQSKSGALTAAARRKQGAKALDELQRDFRRIRKGKESDYEAHRALARERLTRATGKAPTPDAIEREAQRIKTALHRAKEGTRKN